jgi:hypothetical protein
MVIKYAPSEHPDQIGHPTYKAGVIYTDSVDRTPELSRELALRPRIPWTDRVCLENREKSRKKYPA